MGRTTEKATTMLGVNNCGTVLQGGLGNTCAAEGVGVEQARIDTGEAHPPTNILHAAYVGALELIKSMVAVSGRDSFWFVEDFWGRRLGFEVAC